MARTAAWLVGLAVALCAVAPTPGAAQAAGAAPPAPAAETAPARPPDSCSTCHLEIGDDRLAAPVKAFAEDIHRAKGLGCVACHGGDPKEAGMEAMDPARGYIGVPKRAQMAQVCGRCHSDAEFMRQYNPSLRVDQVTEYASSVHGRRLRQTGDEKVAVCASCHPAHSIRPASDPKSSVHPLRVADTCGRCHADAQYMKGRRIPTNQVQEYKRSVHWRTMSAQGDLSAPTCNDCHGNHGAAPPGVSWVGNVCGQCHTVMADLFKASPHAKILVDLGSPGCATCHDNHAVAAAGDELLGADAGTACSACHAADDKGGQAATGMRARIDALRAALERARAALTTAEHSGMEVSQAQFDLNAAGDALVKARAAVHAFSVPAVERETAPGLAVADKALARARRAMEELRFRRTGLGVSLIVILALIVGVVLKIRQIEARPASRAAAGYRGETDG